jgi:hypothetical protein
MGALGVEDTGASAEDASDDASAAAARVASAFGIEAAAEERAEDGELASELETGGEDRENSSGFFDVTLAAEENPVSGDKARLESVFDVDTEVWRESDSALDVWVDVTAASTEAGDGIDALPLVGVAVAEQCAAAEAAGVIGVGVDLGYKARVFSEHQVYSGWPEHVPWPLSEQDSPSPLRSRMIPGFCRPLIPYLSAVTSR